MAAIMAVCAIVMVIFLVDPSRRAFAVILAATLLPAMINLIPAQANMAAEDLAANVPASLAANLVYVIGVVLALALNWGLVGLAATVFVMKVLDLVIRITPAMKRFGQYPKGVLPPDLRRKDFSYSPGRT